MKERLTEIFYTDHDFLQSDRNGRYHCSNLLSLGVIINRNIKNINKTTTINADIHKAYFISDNYPTEFEHPYLKYIYIN